MIKTVILLFFLIAPFQNCLFSQTDTIVYTSEKFGLTILTQNVDSIEIYEKNNKYPNPWPTMQNMSSKLFIYNDTPLKITLYDVNMKRVVIFLWENILSGAYRFDWWEQIKNLSSGTYQIEVATNQKLETKNVIFVK